MSTRDDTQGAAAEGADSTSVNEAIAAVKAGDVDALEKWLKHGSEVNAYDEEGWTVLLWAAARGNAEAISLLLKKGADIAIAHRESGALPIHLAAQSGRVDAVEVLLGHAPSQLNSIFMLNGHAALLQAVFYGHLPLTEVLLKKRADTAITTARGLGPMELATQFQNQPMMDLLRPYDSSAEKKAAYYKQYLKQIAPVIPPGEADAQALADRLVDAVQQGLAQAAKSSGAAGETMAEVRRLVENDGVDVNRLGGPLQQPALVVAVTGNNGWPTVKPVAELRNELAFYLMEHGASPIKHENHPMGAQTIIRASVFNHLEILKRCAVVLTPQEMADAINEYPLVNGLTALHDTVLRASMAGADRIEGYIEQLRFLIRCGGRTDIGDFSGVTQRDIAERTEDPERRELLLRVIDNTATG